MVIDIDLAGKKRTNGPVAPRSKATVVRLDGDAKAEHDRAMSYLERAMAYKADLDSAMRAVDAANTENARLSAEVERLSNEVARLSAELQRERERASTKVKKGAKAKKEADSSQSC